MGCGAERPVSRAVLRLVVLRELHRADDCSAAINGISNGAGLLAVRVVDRVAIGGVLNSLPGTLARGVIGDVGGCG